MIYYDDSEVGTRLGQSVIEVGVPLTGLEQYTGADFLISPLLKPLPRIVHSGPGLDRINEHLAVGMLVQRKSEADFLSSIPKLDHILQRMQNRGSICWLLVNGTFKPIDEHVMVNGRTTGWKWRAYRGALDAWQFRGGMVHEEPTDALGDEWLLAWDRKLPALLKSTDKLITPKPLAGIDGGIFHPRPWEQTLASLPDCGPQRAEVIGSYCGTLASSLWWITDPNAKPLPGIGPKLREKWQRYLGLTAHQSLVPVTNVSIATGTDDPFVTHQMVTAPGALDLIEINSLLAELPY